MMGSMCDRVRAPDRVELVNDGSNVLYPALERNDPDRSFDQVRAAPPLRPLPLVVLSADPAWGRQIPSMIAAGKLPADVPPDFGYVTECRAERGAGSARQARAERETHQQHEQRPRDTQGAASTRDRLNPQGR